MYVYIYCKLRSNCTCAELLERNDKLSPIKGFYKFRGFLARKRNIPTYRPPLVGELVATSADRGVSRGQSGGYTLPLISVF
jgi:hypothetical protein